jgi:hypothetical protein
VQPRELGDVFSWPHLRHTVNLVQERKRKRQGKAKSRLTIALVSAANP